MNPINLLQNAPAPPARHPPGIKMVRIWHRRFREVFLTLLLFIQVFILFIMPCLKPDGLPVPLLAVDAILLIFVGFAIALSRSKAAIITLIISVILTIVGIIWRHEDANFLTNLISATGQVLTLLSLLWVVATAVFGPGRITYHRIMGAVVMYLCIGMIFIDLDILLVRTIPNAFSHLPANDGELRAALTYFSFGTLTTGNFGDIAPLHPIARSLANLESICGQLFPATLLARIVGLHGSKAD